MMIVDGTARAEPRTSRAAALRAGRPRGARGRGAAARGSDRAGQGGVPGAVEAHARGGDRGLAAFGVVRRESARDRRRRRAPRRAAHGSATRDTRRPAGGRGEVAALPDRVSGRGRHRGHARARARRRARGDPSAGVGSVSRCGCAAHRGGPRSRSRARLDRGGVPGVRAARRERRVPGVQPAGPVQRRLLRERARRAARGLRAAVGHRVPPRGAGHAARSGRARGPQGPTEGRGDRVDDRAREQARGAARDAGHPARRGAARAREARAVHRYRCRGGRAAAAQDGVPVAHASRWRGVPPGRRARHREWNGARVGGAERVPRDRDGRGSLRSHRRTHGRYAALLGVRDGRSERRGEVSALWRGPAW